MPKHEYRVRITYTGHHTVYVEVEAEDEDEAKRIAEEKFYNGETEDEGQPEPTVEVDWSDEED